MPAISHSLGESEHAGQALLAALAELIRPIAHKYSVSTTYYPGHDTKASVDSAHEQNRIQHKALGQDLLICFERFIVSTISPESHTTDLEILDVYDEKQGRNTVKDMSSDNLKVEEEHGITSVPVESDTFSGDEIEIQPPDDVNCLSDDDDNTSSISAVSDARESDSELYPIDTTATRMMQTPSPLMSITSGDCDLPPKILEILRWHIFNKMPIRLLAFGSDGSGMQLLERNDIFHCLSQIIQTEFFQPCFLSALDKLRIATPYKQWEEEETKLFTLLIERHAKYAILSHTWIRDTYVGDVIYNNWKTAEQNARGYAKIANFCKVAAQDHDITFGWMDTVCINKDSSSELDESIRSMYKWYRRAHVCVIYLSETQKLSQTHNDSWFTRGWTLQELLAPTNSCFYNQDWVKLITDSKDFTRIQSEIEIATSISSGELDVFKVGNTNDIPISRVMQLADNRVVTREEDISYSIMGLLGVDIPISYGEGSERAFFRLVRELLNSKRNVFDIFNHNYYPSNRLISSTIKQYIARSSDFDVKGYGYDRNSPLNKWPPPKPLILTHMGVRVTLLLIPAAQRHALTGPDGTVNHYKPYGRFHGVALLHTSSNTLTTTVGAYNVLDAFCFETSKMNSDNDPPRKVVTLGVLNFGIKGDYILLPRECLFVPLDYDVVKMSGVIPPDVKILPTRTRVAFRLETVDNVAIGTLPRSHLEKHGMRITTLYL